MQASVMKSLTAEFSLTLGHLHLFTHWSNIKVPYGK